MSDHRRRPRVLATHVLTTVTGGAPANLPAVPNLELPTKGLVGFVPVKIRLATGFVPVKNPMAVGFIPTKNQPSTAPK